MARPPLLRLIAAVAAALALLLAGAPDAGAAEPPDAVSGVATTAIPGPARAALPLILDLTTHGCPELPPVWVVAQVQAESGWDASLHADQAGGPAGLYQISAANWGAAGGQAWPSDPPADGADVLSPEAHLKIAVPWICANLRAVTEHLKATGKTAAPLDAMLVCHIAGCGRVTGSRTGVPEAGEAGCGQRCSEIVHRYVDAVHENVTRYSAPATPTPATPTPPAPTSSGASPAPPGAPAPRPSGPPGPPAAWTGGVTGCTLDDPTSGGCISGATRHGLDAVGAAFGGWHAGPAVHDTRCWDRHAWNPRSDHATGRACDFMVTRPGTFSAGAERDNGWKVAGWLRANAGPLHLKYLIWQGRYWDPGTRDDPGAWGVRYTGGGVYDVRTATGGHFDHVHASFGE